MAFGGVEDAKMGKVIGNLIKNVRLPLEAKYRNRPSKPGPYPLIPFLG